MYGGSRAAECRSSPSPPTGSWPHSTTHRSSPRRWLLWLSGRLSNAHTRLLSLLAGDVRAQVAALLDQESCRGDTTRLTHHDIASMAGAQRSSVTRALDDLATKGVIATGYGQATIRDHDSLVAVARSTPGT
ncbi:MAG: Crp/Fnr family transcriptional regulator [Microbacteriaceae bacterium]